MRDGETFNFTIHSHEVLGPDCARIVLKPVSSEYIWRSGQYLRASIDGETFKPYSIATPYTKGSYPEIHVKASGQGGLSDALVGDHKNIDNLIVTKAAGKMALPEDISKVVFICGGVGFAPVWSLANTIDHDRVETYILTAARTLEDCYWLEWMSEGVRFKHHNIVEDDAEGAGSIIDLMDRLHPEILNDQAHFIVAGPPAMVRAVVDRLENQSITSERIIYDTHDL